MALVTDLNSIINMLTAAKTQMQNFEDNNVKASGTRVRVDLLKAKKDIDTLRKSILAAQKALPIKKTRSKIDEVVDDNVEEVDDNVEEVDELPPSPPKLVRSKSVRVVLPKTKKKIVKKVKK